MQTLLSIRRCGCDAKVSNIPEVKVNRHRCVDCTARNIICVRDEAFNQKTRRVKTRDEWISCLFKSHYLNLT